MRREWILCSLLAALTVAVYWPVRQHDFVCYDEFAMILQNPLVLGGLTLPGLSWALTLAVANGDQALLEKNRQLLELYRASKPYHEPAVP